MKFLKNDDQRYSFALILSLLLHIFIFKYAYQNTAEDKIRRLKLSQKSSQRLDTVKLDSVKFITKKQLQAAKEVNKQIVANEVNGKQERPVNSRFLGEKDQVFDRQTIAAINGAFKKAGKGSKQENVGKINQMNEPVVATKKQDRANKIKNNLKTLRLSDLGTIQISKIEDEEQLQREALEEMSKKLSSGTNKNSNQGIANGSSDEIGYARNNDFVEEVPLGDMTNLNTTEFKYYGFYYRIRQRLEQYWGSSIQSKARNLYKSGRRLPTSENLITAVIVTLDDRGQIVDIKIDGTSGVRELDQAAVESFNQAGPFPNPPKGLLVDGRAVIQWGFVVKS